MSIKRYAVRRDKNERDIITALRAVGASVAMISEKGMPDLLVGFRGETYLLETKGRRGRLTHDQQDWHENWRGRRAIVVTTVEGALFAIGAME